MRNRHGAQERFPLRLTDKSAQTASASAREFLRGNDWDEWCHVVSTNGKNPRDFNITHVYTHTHTHMFIYIDICTHECVRCDFSQNHSGPADIITLRMVFTDVWMLITDDAYVFIYIYTNVYVRRRRNTLIDEKPLLPHAYHTLCRARSTLRIRWI